MKGERTHLPVAEIIKQLRLGTSPSSAADENLMADAADIIENSATHHGWADCFIEALESEQRADQTIVAFFHPDCSWDVWNATASEDILKWGYRAADEQRAREMERVAKELSYAFASDTMGDHINVWWAALAEKDRAKRVASVRAALRGRHA